MDKKIICIVLIVLLLIVIIYNNKEYFNIYSCGINLTIKNPAKDAIDCCGNYNIVYKNDGTSNTNQDYDIVKYGPKCLNTCLVEHVAKLEFEGVTQRVEVLNRNRSNPSSDRFCHTHNDDTKKINNRKNECADDDCGGCLNDTNCKKDNNICVENKLNYLSGGAILNSTKCSGTFDEFDGCVNKYITNIEAIKDVYDADIKSQEQCSTD